MQYLKFILLLSFVIFFLDSCTNKNQVHVATRNFETEVELQQNLIFTFDKDLVADTLVDQWDTLSYIKFIPNVKGKFKWNSTKELVFSPISGFLPSSDYKAELTTFLFSHSKARFGLPDEKIFSFHTSYLKLLTASGYWAKSDKVPGNAALLLSLNFNYKIDPGTLSHLLHVMMNGQNTNFEMKSSSVNDVITVTLDGIAKNEIGNVPVKIFVDKGMKCAESDYTTDKEMNLEITIPSPDKLAITQTAAEYEGTQGMIHVFTTQALEEAGLNDAIKIEPAMKFTTQATGNGFYIKGNFSSGSTYQLIISKSVKGALGGELESDYSSAVLFGELAPAISFINQKGVYLSTKSARNVAVNIVNIPKVHVRIYKIYENNIIHYLDHNRNRSYDYDGGDEGDEDGERSYHYSYDIYDANKYGDIMFEHDYETKDLTKINGASMLNLTFDQGNSFKGIYVVSIASKQNQWLHAIKLVSISDIGLIAKQTDDEVYVFTNSIKTAEPISGATVSFISSNNQSVGTVTTNSDGIAVFSNVKKNAPNFIISMITVRNGSDFNYLQFNDARVNNSRFDVGGRRANPAGYLAFMYGDRDIYRPGETVYLNTIVRDEQWSPVSDMPVKLKLLLPNGKEYKVMRGMLNKQGAFETSIPLPQATVTGTYIAELFTSTDMLLNSRNISVEEFMPDRIDVKLTTTKEELKTNDSMKVNIKAVNFFGPPAAGRKYEMEYSLARKYFSSKEFPSYNFNIALKENLKLNENKVREGKTNDQGEAKEAVNVPAEYENIGLLNGKIFVTVFDETGRPVNRVKNFDVYTQDLFYGIRMEDNYVRTKQAMNIPLIACDKKGKARAASAQVQVVQYDWYSVIEKSEYGDGYHYVSHKKEIILLDQTVQMGDKGFALNYTPGESGEYEVRVKKPGTEHYVASLFYAYGWGYTNNTSFSVNTEGQVDIQLDKAKYAVGDEANILFKTPFNGKLLVTVECEKMLEYYYLNTDKKSAMLSLNVKDNYLPNVYITATLFRPLDEGAIPITVGHGFAPLMVEKDRTKIPVTIMSAEQSRSKTKQTITVKAAPNSEITVAVVDEGILALKNYKTPDPHGFFYQKKALAVHAFDLYPNLLPDLKLRRSSTGGDKYDLAKRVNPLTNKRVQLVALWSGILTTNSSGEVNYTVDIPQFSGDLRIMACNYKDNSFGSAEKHIKVADPIVISPSIPRFLSPKDTLVMPVTLTNTTTKAAIATASLSLSGALSVIGDKNQNVTINPKSEKRVEFKILAAPVIGNGSITINVNALGENFTDKTEITIRPSTSLLKVSEAGVINNTNGIKSINLKNDFIPSSVTAKLVFSQNPMVQFSKQLTYLVGYPFGCIEQTTSKAFPQIYYSELVKNVKNAERSIENPAHNVQEAIHKIEGMQLYNGSFSYWPGGVYENWWATVYALHFLIEAKKAGYDVNSQLLDRVVAYNAQKVKAHETETYYYWDSANILQHRTIAKKENCYSLFIMALYGKADLPSMNYYKSNTGLLALDSRYLLACTYLALGDRKSYDELLPKSFEGERSKNEFGGSFYSFVRDEGVALNALLETDPDNPQVGEIVRHLTQQMKKDNYWNTQENAFAFLALGKFIKRQSENPVTATISMNGKPVASYDGKDVILTQGISGNKIDVSVSGKGNLYYFWEAEGLSSTGDYKEEDKFLRARKTFYNRFGQQISLRDVKQSELIVVQLSVVNSENSNIENVVVTDMLPAGFEIENPRIGEVKEMNWVKNKSTPDYFDVRDDRINFFTSLNSTPKNFYYLVRAVSLGSYRMGPVSADAMYNGEYHSYNGATTVRVNQ